MINCPLNGSSDVSCAAAEDWSRQTRVLSAGDQTDRGEILRYARIYITGVHKFALSKKNLSIHLHIFHTFVILTSTHI